MSDLHKALEQFLTAFAREVAVQVVNELDARTLRHNRERAEAFARPRSEFDATALKLDKREMACPNAAAHPRHVWSFPKSSQSHQCPGVNGFPGEPCLKTDAHAPHDWELDDVAGYGTLGRHCPGRVATTGFPAIAPVERQCPDNLAHHTHVWHAVNGRQVKRGTPEAVKYGCLGLEADLEVQWCASRPYDHGAHEWTPRTTGTVAPNVFCRGLREVPVSRCLEDRTHLPHNWQDEQDKTAACPGKSRPWDTNVVPAGPDRPTA